MYIFGMCDCPFKVRILGAMNGLVAMEVGGGGDGLHAESDWDVWLRHWRLSVLTFTPLLRSLKRAGLCRQSPCQGGWNKE